MNLLLRVIGVLQVAGGFYGVFSVLRAVAGGHASLVMLIGMALSAVALVAGVLLLEGQAQGARLSRIVQAAQIPVIATSWFSYDWHIGAALPLYLRLGQPLSSGVDWTLPSQGLRLAADGPGTAMLGVNALALVAWLVLWHRR